MPDSFFVDPASGTATTIPDEPRWGYDRRSCDVCSADWGQFGCSRSGCTSVSFTTTVIPPIPIGTEKPKAKAPAPRASAELVRRLRARPAQVAQLVADLLEDDRQLRAALIDGVEELIPLQRLWASAVGMSGDKSRSSALGLTLGMDSFATFAGIDLEHLGDANWLGGVPRETPDMPMVFSPSDLEAKYTTEAPPKPGSLAELRRRGH